MTQTIIYISIFSILIIGVLLGVLLARKIKKKGGKQRLEKANEALRKKKEGGKEKILNLLKEKPQITNDDVQKLLNVSDATATNYLDELEKDDEIVQKGQEGRGVEYTPKNG